MDLDPEKIEKNKEALHKFVEEIERKTVVLRGLEQRLRKREGLIFSSLVNEKPSHLFLPFPITLL